MDTTPPPDDIVLYREPLSNCCGAYKRQKAAEDARHKAALAALRKRLTDSPQYKANETTWAAEQKSCNDQLTAPNNRAFSYVDCMQAANRGHAARGAEIEAEVYTPFYNTECAAHQERMNYIEYARYTCCSSQYSHEECCVRDDGKPIDNPM